CPVLPVHTVQGAHVLLDLWADLVVLQVGGRGGGHDGSTTDVVQVADHVAELRGAVVLGGVGEQLAGEVPAFRAGLCVGDRRFQPRTHQRRVDDHFGDLVSDVRDALGPVGFCDELGQADEGVTDLDKVCRSTEALPQSEGVREGGGVCGFSGQEDTFVGYEDVVEQDEALRHVVVGAVGEVFLPAARGVAGVDDADTGCVDGDGAGHGPVLLTGLHLLGRHDDHFVADRGRGDVQLGAAYHDAVGAAFDDTGVVVGVVLFAR